MSDTISAILTPQFVTSMIVIVLILHLALGAAAYFILLERKICSWIQDRVGPNRVGPLGLLQPIADGLKLFMKEDFIPSGVDKTLFIIAPALTAIPAIIGFAVIPYGGLLDISTIPFISDWQGWSGTVEVVGANVNIGIIYLVATASLGVYGVALGGWASNNKFSFLGGLRASAQMVSYEIPMGLSLLCVVLTVGTVYPLGIVEHQLDHGWNLLQQPIAAVIFYICMLAEANRTPFDLAEAEAELVGGWHTEYSSMKWALFFLGEYVNLFVGGAFFAVLFLGGWSLNPIGGILPFDLPTAGSIWLILLQVSVVIGKAFLLVVFAMIIRWTVPRFRFDQLMKLAWEGMIPATLVLLLATSFAIFMGYEHYMWIVSLATLGLIILAYPLIPRQANPNHKIGLIGSRFSPHKEHAGRAAPSHPAAVVDAPLSQG